MSHRKKIPFIQIAEWIGGNKVALFFTSGRAVEVVLPWVKSAKKVRIVDQGMGLDPGNGKEVSGLMLVRDMKPERVLAPGDRGWVGF